MCHFKPYILSLLCQTLENYYFLIGKRIVLKETETPTKCIKYALRGRDNYIGTKAGTKENLKKQHLKIMKHLRP